MAEYQQDKYRKESRSRLGVLVPKSDAVKNFDMIHNQRKGLM